MISHLFVLITFTFVFEVCQANGHPFHRSDLQLLGTFSHVRADSSHGRPTTEKRLK
jgi:hypothetical protein